jgi:hypothetical protein
MPGGNRNTKCSKAKISLRKQRRYDQRGQHLARPSSSLSLGVLHRQQQLQRRQQRRRQRQRQRRQQQQQQQAHRDHADMRRGSGKCSTICHQRLRADGSKDTQTSSDEESEAEVEEEEEESDDEFCDRTTAPVPKWEVLAGNRAVWVQLCQQLRLGQGRGVWVRGDGTGASRPGAVTPRLARTSAETPGGGRSSGAPGATTQRGRAAPRQLRANNK